jgi:hypothetical protein
MAFYGGHCALIGYACMQIKYPLWPIKERNLNSYNSKPLTKIAEFSYFFSAVARFLYPLL